MNNTLYFGDNLEVLRKHIKDESVDLIYLDPPFNSQATYNKIFSSPVRDPADAQIRAFEDTWKWESGAEIAMEDVRERSPDTFKILLALQSFLGRSDMMAYLAMMAARLVELKRALKQTGSLYLHCDPTASHYLKILLDAIFDVRNYRSEVSWRRQSAHNDAAQGRAQYGNVRDTILFYTKSERWTWNWLYTPYSGEYVRQFYRYVEQGTNRRYRLGDITAPGGADPKKRNPTYEFLGITRYWRYSKERMGQLFAEGRIIQTAPGRVPQYKRYLDEMPGVALQNDWSDIQPLHGANQERLGYPTQKPLTLMERIISASSNPGDVVLDPFCGCGTTIHAAETLGRQWIGIDVTYVAIQVIIDRLKTWLPQAKYRVDGIPFDEQSARELAKLNPYQFQLWAVGRCGGQPRGKGADGGVDGDITFLRGVRDYGKGIISVKAGRNLTPDMVRSLRGTLPTEDADMGVFVCVDEPTRQVRTEAASAGVVDLPGGRRPRIQIVTASDLIAGPNLGIPTALNSVQAAEASRDLARRKPRPPTPQEIRREPKLKLPIKGGRARDAQRTLELNEPMLVQQPARRGRKSA